ncbi:NlpC/P60 family protein [Caldalkalibacillus salinus]|uniref:NlpC/P60 family protein n=1 Tax=Caldalkalibacillus salinus TaxID=2803787 RepID=UPI001922EA5C
MQLRHGQKVMIMLLLSVLVSACGTGDQGMEQQNQDESFIDLHVNPFSADQSENGALQKGQETMTLMLNGETLDDITTYRKGGLTYVPLVPVLELLNYKVVDEGQDIKAGFTDVLLAFDLQTNRTLVEGEEVRLSSPLTMVDEEVLIPVISLNQILGENVEAKKQDRRITINTERETESYGFKRHESLDDLPQDDNGDTEDIPAVAPQVADSIIETAKQYLGTPYVFGSPSGYEETFDCSSFTQYVYKQHGIDLPRVSRHQAKRGEYVPVKDLKRGDLLFFYWPGRFESNRIVGHVGIYAGHGYMIHASPVPEDGVQIENLNKRDSLYREVYLGAKRISTDTQ